MVLHVIEESKCIVYFLCARTNSSRGQRPDRPVRKMTLTIHYTQEITLRGNYDLIQNDALYEWESGEADV